MICDDLDERLPGERDEELAAHLASCADCRARAEAARRLPAIVASRARPLSPGLRERVLAGIAADPVGQPAPSLAAPSVAAPRRGRSFLAFAVAAAGLAGIFALVGRGELAPDLPPIHLLPIPYVETSPAPVVLTVAPAPSPAPVSPGPVVMDVTVAPVGSTTPIFFDGVNVAAVASFDASFFANLTIANDTSATNIALAELEHVNVITPAEHDYYVAQFNTAPITSEQRLALVRNLRFKFAQNQMNQAVNQNGEPQPAPAFAPAALSAEKHAAAAK